MNRFFSFFFIFVFGIVSYSFSISTNRGDFTALVNDMADNLSSLNFYKSIANPNLKYVKIVEGMRKEEILAMMEKRFDWNESDKSDFLGYDHLRVEKFEGRYFPDSYLLPRDITGADFKRMTNEKTASVLNELGVTSATSTIDVNDVLTIASIIQREAGGKSDMNIISGVIKNRIARGMSLDMDATLQYVKGTEDIGWWPRVKSIDKLLDSEYNTYKNKGLPPTPIANPGLAAISAALSPEKTNCLYYFHKNKKIYCSTNYEDHKKKIDLYLK